MALQYAVIGNCVQVAIHGGLADPSYFAYWNHMFQEKTKSRSTEQALVAATPSVENVSTFSSPLLCRKDAARYLGLRAQTLAQWAYSRRVGLPYIKVGKRAMYRKADLDAFIAANMRGGSDAHEVCHG